MNNQEFIQKAFEHLLAKEAAKNIMPMMGLDSDEVEDTPEVATAPAKYVYHNAYTKDTKGVIVYLKQDDSPYGISETLYSDKECTVPVDVSNLWQKLEDGATIVVGYTSVTVDDEGLPATIEAQTPLFQVTQISKEMPEGGMMYGYSIEVHTPMVDGYIYVIKEVCPDGRIIYDSNFSVA